MPPLFVRIQESGGMAAALQIALPRPPANRPVERFRINRRIEDRAAVDCELLSGECPFADHSRRTSRQRNRANGVGLVTDEKVVDLVADHPREQRQPVSVVSVVAAFVARSTATIDAPLVITLNVPA